MILFIYGSFVTIQINTALKPTNVISSIVYSFVTIQINTALKQGDDSIDLDSCFVTIQINTALKPTFQHTGSDGSFVTIQINTALKPRRRFRNRAARLSQTTDLNDFLYFYKFLVIIKSSSRIYCG